MAIPNKKETSLLGKLFAGGRRRLACDCGGPIAYHIDPISAAMGGPGIWVTSCDQCKDYFRSCAVVMRDIEAKKKARQR